MPHNLMTVLRRTGLTDEQIAAVMDALPPPDAQRLSRDPDYLYSQLKAAGLSTQEAARLLDVNHRQLRYYIAGKREAPYTVQYALEMLALLKNERLSEDEPGSED